jgi:hypothetical protein
METSPESNGPTLFDPTLFAAATPVSLSASPAKGKGKKTRAISGRGYDTPFAFYDPVTRSLRMYEVTCLLAELPSLAKLPPSGILRNGVLFLRPPWEQITDAIESSSWPTPRAGMQESRNHTVWERSLDKPQNLENRVATVDPTAVGGKLNPEWVEWLMGFPTGWTDLKDSETPSSPK